MAMASQSSQQQHHPPRRPIPAPSNQVIIESQKQWYFTDEELTRTPSLLDGMSLETEHVQRSKGVNFIVQVGIMLKLPQLTLTTAAVFLHRFFVRYSMVDLPRRPGLHPYSVAAGCLFLASKVDENCRKIKELVIACCRVAQKNNNLEVDEQNKEFWRWKDTLLAYEDLCLEALCFDLQLEQPHKICYEFLCYFGKSEHKGLRNAAWAFLNDSNYTVLCLQFYPRTIAAAALWAGARLCDVAFEDDEEGRPWWVQLDVNLSEVRRAVSRMVQLYEKNITVHRQSHEYPTIQTDSDNTQETTRIVNPNPHSITESTTAGELNGRKRSREAEGEDYHSSPIRRVSSYDSNNARERSPSKRQRLTPEPSRASLTSGSPRSTSNLANGHHQTPRAANSRIPSGAVDDIHRRPSQQHSHPLPPPPLPSAASDQAPGPVDPVQQRIDEIVQQGMARSDKVPPTVSRNDSHHHSGRHREWDRERERDRDRDRDRDWRRGDNYEAEHRDRGSRGGRDHRDNDKTRNSNITNNKDRVQRERKSSSTTNESSSTVPRRASNANANARIPAASQSQQSQSSPENNFKGDREQHDDENGEEGEITEDREEGEVVTTNNHHHTNHNNTNHSRNFDNEDDDAENRTNNNDDDGNDDGDGGGSEEGEV